MLGLRMETAPAPPPTFTGEGSSVAGAPLLPDGVTTGRAAAAVPAMPLPLTSPPSPSELHAHRAEASVTTMHCLANLGVFSRNIATHVFPDTGAFFDRGRS